MKITSKTKAQMEAEHRFCMRVYAELIRLPGATAHADIALGCLIVEVPTPAGPLHLHPRNTNVYGWFEDVERANAAYGGAFNKPNPYTGKWNVHLGAFPKRIEDGTMYETVDKHVQCFMSTLRGDLEFLERKVG